MTVKRIDVVTDFICDTGAESRTRHVVKTKQKNDNYYDISNINYKNTSNDKYIMINTSTSQKSIEHFHLG
jgi:hypothetical protein